MSIAVNESSRPPYVIFQERFAEDRAESMKQGKLVNKSVDWVVVRQAGNKDSSEFEALEWLDRISKNPGFKPEWTDGFRMAYQRWKQGQAPVLNGTSIRTWPAISSAQADMLANITVFTVEDLAIANESTLQRIGIGARELQMKAKAWLDSAQNIGTVSEELAALRQQNKLLLEQNNELRALALAREPGLKVPVQPVQQETDPFGS